MSKKIFSGVQPTGNLHLGNYLGAIKNFVDLNNEEDNKCIFCVVDLHAITVKQNPKELKKNNLFNFNFLFLSRFLRILIATSIMGLFFNYLTNFFDANMQYEQNFKAAYLIGIVFLSLISYFLIAVLIKAFKISDIKLKY